MNYSQNKEQGIVSDYFMGKPGHLLSIGENDGETFSNSRHLLKNLNWSGLLIEPSPTAYAKLKTLYKENNLVKIKNVAIGKAEEWVDFYDMGEHVGNGDSSLLATMDINETKKWDCQFKHTKVRAIPYEHINDVYDFITIDAEGLDIEILKQIDLKHTYCLCIEWNNNIGNLALIRAIVPVQMREIYRSCENVIYVR